MTPIIATKATVRGIHEHSRTIAGRRDPLTGGSSLEHINLGWFIHVDFGPESGPISFCVGPERPAGVAIGDEIIVAIFRPLPNGKPKIVSGND